MTPYMTSTFVLLLAGSISSFIVCFHRGRYDSTREFHTELHQNSMESILGRTKENLCVIHMVLRVLVQALRIPTHVDLFLHSAIFPGSASTTFPTPSFQHVI